MPLCSCGAVSGQSPHTPPEDFHNEIVARATPLLSREAGVIRQGQDAKRLGERSEQHALGEADAPEMAHIINGTDAAIMPPVYKN
jgi:hypothetical protein